VAAAVALTACQVAADPASAEELPSAVVQRSDMLVAVSAGGRIEPQARADLAFEGSGRVAEVLAAEGDRVEVGDVLARLETEQLELQVDQAQAVLRSAQARLAQLESGPRDAELAARMASVASAQAQVDVSQANLDQLSAGAGGAQIAAAEADLASAQAQQRSAEDLHEKTMTCKTVKLPTGEKTTICPALGPVEEQARLNRDAANKNLAAARARLDELLAGPDSDAVRAAHANVAISGAQLEAAQVQVELLLAGPTRAELAAAEAQVRQAQVGLSQAMLSLERATLRSPISGVVATVNVVTGEAPPVGRAAITVIDTTGLRLAFSVDELDVGLLEEGQEAQVTVDALPGTVVSGMVSRVAPAARLESGVVSYDAVVDLYPQEVTLRVDMSANAMVTVDELLDVLVVPTWVVRVDRLTDQTYVERRTGDRIERVDVELGLRREGLAQVLSGLSEGDVVVRSTESGVFSFSLGE
jgi:HlyD family secretion protein